jgi:hypothetical protein
MARNRTSNLEHTWKLGGGSSRRKLQFGSDSKLRNGKTHPSLYLGDSVLSDNDFFRIKDDFAYQTLTEADTPWILNKGSDAQALDPAVTSTKEAGGVVQLVTGNDGTGVAVDGSQLVCSIPMKPSAGGLYGEARVLIAAAVTNAQLVVGFTDTTTLELPASVSGTTITTTASDGCFFVYDTGATTDQWYAIGVDTDVDAPDNALTGIAPTADVYQTLRIEVDSDGAKARFFIDDSLVKELKSAVVTPGVDLFFTVIANATTTTSKTVKVDFVDIGHLRG